MLINSLLGHAICGVRFQPIYSSQENKIKAWEMLSTDESPNDFGKNH